MLNRFNRQLHDNEKKAIAEKRLPGSDLSVISWARHNVRRKSLGCASEEEKANCSASGSGPRAAT